ncbi:MAG: hypothetical protein ACKVU0_15005 [Saprospiraceae bacterium]
MQTDILNAAATFFDFNAPAITNTTQHRVGEDFITVSAWQPLRAGLELRMLPNPVAQTALLELRGLAGKQDWLVELSDAKRSLGSQCYCQWRTMALRARRFTRRTVPVASAQQWSVAGEWEGGAAIDFLKDKIVARTWQRDLSGPRLFLGGKKVSPRLPTSFTQHFSIKIP